MSQKRYRPEENLGLTELGDGLLGAADTILK
jgi:hypothetical protein